MSKIPKEFKKYAISQICLLCFINFCHSFYHDQVGGFLPVFVSLSTDLFVGRIAHKARYRFRLNFQNRSEISFRILDSILVVNWMQEHK